MIPSANFIQLRHIPVKNYAVSASIRTYKEKDFAGQKLNEYRLEYPKLRRTVRIVYENQAPYKVVGWLETYPSAFDGKMRTTKATLHKQKMLPYWSQNSLKDLALRKELGLD